MSAMKIEVGAEVWPFVEPFRITSRVITGSDVVLATITAGGASGRGEAAGVYYRDETTQGLVDQIRQLAASEPTLTRAALAELLGPGGARNALDCALWDLEATLARQPVWKLAGLAGLRPLLTTLTLGNDDPGRMAQAARRLTNARALKLKLIGDGGDGERVAAVRAARPDVWIGVDGNRGFTPATLHALFPALVDARVELVEQPFALDRDADLDGLGAPIPIAADESVQDRRDLAALVGRVEVINIKLDKCGGLTEGLAMAAEARRLGFRVMVGCMAGTSLAVAPGFVLGQLCDLVDLDVPIFLARDREPAASYERGLVWCPEALWGAGGA